MLLRTVVLLLLCLPSGRCATLGHYQTPAKEEEAPAVDPVAVEAPEQETMAADGTVADAPVAVDLVADRPVADEPVTERHEAESKTQIVEAPVTDPPTAEENVADTDELVAEILAADNLVAEELEVDVPIADETGTEALAQDASDEEEGNDSRAVQADQSLGRPLTQEADSSWSLSSVRDSFQTINGYFDSLVELVGGRNGVCEYHCRYGKTPQPRPGYQSPEPNGCSSLLMGFQFDLGIPAMTKCCDQLDVCYDTCGISKYHCDGNFRRCLHDICFDLKKSLGFVSKVEACESVADSLYNTVWTLGCRPYMNSQRAACLCEEEERDEL